jgi:hypothetical protein
MAASRRYTVGMHIDTADAGRALGARALLDQLDDSKVLSLGVLSGAELGVLGGTGQPGLLGAVEERVAAAGAAGTGAAR